MELKPQEVLILLKVIAHPGETWSYARLAAELHMSPAEVHASVARAVAANLAVRKPKAWSPNARALEEFLVHGAKYSFPPDIGPIRRGFPTAHAAPPLNQHISSNDTIQPVWPHIMGPARGQSFSPIYKSAPLAARDDAKLYEMLALLDAIRGGRAREQRLAIELLRPRLVSA